MFRPTQGLLRALRAGSLGVVGFSLALMAHRAAEGAVPGPSMLLLLAGLTGLATFLLTRVRLNPVRVGVSLATMQVVLHEAFMRVGMPTGCPVTAVEAPGGIQMGSRSQPLLECAAGIGQTGIGESSATSPTMVGAHVAATAVTAALLAYGEKILWFLAGWVRPARWLRLGLPELPRVPVMSCSAPRMARVRFDCGGVGRRGPPARDLFATV